MAEQVKPIKWAAAFSKVALIATLIFTAAFFAVTLAELFLKIRDPEAHTKFDYQVLALAMLAELVAAGWFVLLYAVINSILVRETNLANAAASLARVETILQSDVEIHNKLVELAQLSDQAKSLIYRDRELEAFRERFHDYLIHQNYAAAEALIVSLETRMGYADEAVLLRKQIENTRKATLDEKIDAAVHRIQESMDAHNWSRAMREIHRILQLFPHNPKISSLPERLENARNKHKRDLLEAYGDAVKKNDVDHSIELLKELDRYLSPQEAAALEESARGVFKAKLHNLGVQFAISVTDQQWVQAVATGDEIIREFPNTRMSYEVRQKMDLLRTKAAEAAAGK